MYQGIAEGSAVPVNGAGIEDGTGRSEEKDGAGASKESGYDIREDLLSSLPTRHRDKVEA
jgi:hypothetical protein